MMVSTIEGEGDAHAMQMCASSSNSGARVRTVLSCMAHGALLYHGRSQYPWRRGPRSIDQRGLPSLDLPNSSRGSLVGGRGLHGIYCNVCGACARFLYVCKLIVS